MAMKATDYRLDGVNANLLLMPSGIFALSNGDGVDAVTLDLETALLQTDYMYIDAFPKEGGARAVAVKRIEQHLDGASMKLTQTWTSDF